MPLPVAVQAVFTVHQIGGKRSLIMLPTDIYLTVNVIFPKLFNMYLQLVPANTPAFAAIVQLDSRNGRNPLFPANTPRCCRISPVGTLGSPEWINEKVRILLCARFCLYFRAFFDGMTAVSPNLVNSNQAVNPLTAPTLP